MYARFENWDDNPSSSLKTVGSKLNSESIEGEQQPSANPLMGGNADFLMSSEDAPTPF